MFPVLVALLLLLLVAVVVADEGRLLGSQQAYGAPPCRAGEKLLSYNKSEGAQRAGTICVKPCNGSTYCPPASAPSPASVACAVCKGFGGEA